MQPRKYTEEFLTGKTFGFLTYVGASHTPAKSGVYYSTWRCECGKEIVTLDINVVKGRKKSCGCKHWRTGEHSAHWKGCGKMSGAYWSGIKCGAYAREIPFRLTKEEAWETFLKQSGKCVMTGIDLTFDTLVNTSDGTASLDRIDSSKGYTKDNVQWVHKDINYIKRDLSDSEFITLCKKVATHRA